MKVVRNVLLAASAAVLVGLALVAFVKPDPEPAPVPSPVVSVGEGIGRVIATVAVEVTPETAEQVEVDETIVDAQQTLRKIGADFDGVGVLAWP